MPAGDVLDEEGPEPVADETYELPPGRRDDAGVQAPSHGAEVEPDESADSEWVDEEVGRAGRR